MKIKLVLITTLLISSVQNVQAWGGRGHDSICQAAVYLVKNKELKDFLTMRPHTMGHLCNVPDIYWKSLGSEVSKLGNSTHFIDIELIGLSLEKIPLDYKQIVKEYTGSKNQFKEGTIFSIPTEFGSLWWRADQFYRNVVQLKSTFEGAEPPKNSKEEQDDKLAYNSAVYNMMVNMGLMGHYVADNAQPLHTTADYDGFKAGHGGIHSYYEEAVVAQLGEDLQYSITKNAQKIRKSNPKFLTEKTTIEKMRALALLTTKDLATVFKLDPVLKKSELQNKGGLEIKTGAQRKDAAAGLKVYKNIIVTQMARSSLLLANLWDEAYQLAGHPELQKYKSYRTPLTPDFIPPDYFEADKK